MIKYSTFALALALSLGLTSNTKNYASAFTPASLSSLRGIKLPESATLQIATLSPYSVRDNIHLELRMIGGSRGGGNFYRTIRQNNSEGNDDDDDDEEEVEKDPYTEAAYLEFGENTSDNEDDSSDLSITTSVDWGGAYGKLQQRLEDVEAGRTGPSNALFRIMSKESPNEAISNFVKEADPEIVAVMNGAIGSLLGGLSNPVIGIETIVNANQEKLANLCFQLQMTGYMFRNAEYVLALKDLMKIDPSSNILEYKEAFDRIDADGSGYIEASEVENLLADVYGEEIPRFEVKAFLNFFDSNNDGRISWDEFEKGLGALTSSQAAEKVRSAMDNGRMSLPGGFEDDEDDYIDTNQLFEEPDVSGVIKVEQKNGKVIEIEAKEYIKELKKEAEALKEAIKNESGMKSTSSDGNGSIVGASDSQSNDKKAIGSIAAYIASLQGDMENLTSGISPEIVETMKLLIDFVLDGGPGRNRKGMQDKDKDYEMQIPGSALQQLALWQLVLGYKLREEEATGNFLRLLDE